MRMFARVAALSLAFAALLAAVGCSASGTAQDPAALQGVDWQLVKSSVSSADLAGVGITAAFEKDQMSGFSGINQYSGGYTAKDDGSFKAGPLAGTMMAGPEPLMKAEAAYLALLEKCDTFSIADGKLTLSSGTDASLVYEAAKAVELPGTKWVVTGYNNGKQAVVGPLDGSELTLDFGTDGTASGNGGVNRFNGPFESTKDTVKIGPLASTMMAGEPAVTDQETQYTTALQAAVTWKVVNGMLEMRDADGAIQVLAKSGATP